MKWFKHFSDASNDEFISDLEDEFGLVGYGRWWKLLEAIAAQMEAGSNKCSASYSEKKWCRKLQCKPKVLVRFLECTDNAGKTKTKRNGNIIEISCCKLLKLRDNHSANLQVAGKKLESDLALEVEVEVEEEKQEDSLDVWIRKEIHKVIGRTMNGNEYSKLPLVLSYSRQQIEAALTATKKNKGNSLNYILKILQDMPEEKKREPAERSDFAKEYNEYRSRQ